MPYLSKAPLSFAIQTPVAIGPIDEYAIVILVCASAAGTCRLQKIINNMIIAIFMDFELAGMRISLSLTVTLSERLPPPTVIPAKAGIQAGRV